jgi:hypothetical protein
MDQYRAAACLDLLNEVTAETRIASGLLVTGTHTGAPELDAPEPGAPEPGAPGTGREPGNSGPDGSGPGAPGLLSGHESDQQAPRRLTDLVIPLRTLLGLADRPGEGHGLGPVDPRLCRELAAAAIRSPWTRLCVTITDPDGIAIGHGCAKPPRPPKAGAPSAPPGLQAGPHLPAQLNLTISLDQDPHPALRPVTRRGTGTGRHVRVRPPSPVECLPAQ